VLAVEAVQDSTSSRDLLVARAGTALDRGNLHRARDLADIGLNALPNAVKSAALLCVRAAAELGLGRSADALRSARRASLLKPERPAEAHGLAGMAAARLGRHDDAGADFACAAALEPGRAAWHAGLATALLELDDGEGAARAATIALGLDDGNVDARLVSGRLALRKGQPEEAVAWLAPAADRAPERADVRTTLGVALSASGDFSAGLREYQWRQRLPGWNPRPFNIPAWDGSPVAGKRVLVWTEQGLGDSIQFARFATGIVQCGAHVIYHGEPRLLRLFQTCPGFHELWSHHAPRPSADVHASLMSLPALLEAAGKGGIPAGPYLNAEPAVERLWRDLLCGERPSGRPLCGLAWQGNPGFCDDGQRSMALAHLLPMLRSFAGRIDFISLQKGFGRDQLEFLPADAPVEDLGADLDRGPDGFVDSAAVLASIDLLITTDTALAHLAGALGRPVWTLLAQVPDWRWGVTGTSTPWYPTMRLFRQAHAHDWPGVVADVGRALASWIARVPGR